MDKKVFIVIGVIIALFGGLYAYSANVKTTAPVSYGRFEREKIVTLSETMDFSGYDLTKEIPADEQSGGLPENVVGNPAKAKVVIIEYADYECSHCAESNTKVNKLLEKHPDDVALIYRDYLLSYNANATVAASAAEAAAMQGYWKAFKDYLFANQNLWYALKSDKAAEKFEDYFDIVTNGEGLVTQFHDDMRSETVAKKLAFDYGLAELVNIEGTPTFYVNGEKTAVGDLETTVNKLLAK